jgi:[ribosomal protein S5]-alanine N-acetyltransferase
MECLRGAAIARERAGRKRTGVRLPGASVRERAGARRRAGTPRLPPLNQDVASFDSQHSIGAMAAPTELRTERLTLRWFRESDVVDALTYRNNDEFARFLPHVPQPFTKQDAEAFVKLNMSEPQESSVTFAVVLSERVIGTVNLELDRASRTAMLGYGIGREWWGQGLATEAARAAMAWGIEEFGLVRVWASTDVRHVRSRRVLEKLGLQPEVLRSGDHLGRNGESVDEIVYALDISR